MLPGARAIPAWVRGAGRSLGVLRSGWGLPDATFGLSFFYPPDFLPCRLELLDAREWSRRCAYLEAAELAQDFGFRGAS